MKMRLISAAFIVLLGASMADAGVLRFLHRHAVKPAVKVSGKAVAGTAKGGAKATKAVAKAAYKVVV